MKDHFNNNQLPRIASGVTGECTWTLTGASGNYTLVISGHGAMADYDPETGSPWREYREEITALVIEHGVTSIGEVAFFRCWALTSVILPGSATAIGEGAFAGCGSLTSVVIPDSVTGIGDWAFAFCSGLTSVVIPDSVTGIGDGTFYDCGALTSVVIPDAVTEIGEEAFAFCSGLTSVILPDSVTKIGVWAFACCTSLTSVINYSSTPQDISEGTFDDTRTATLRVPSSAVEAYKNAEGWKDFGTIIGM